MRGPRSAFRPVPFALKPKAARRHEPLSLLPAPGAGLLGPRAWPPAPPAPLAFSESRYQRSNQCGEGAAGGKAGREAAGPGPGQPARQVAAAAGEGVRCGGAVQETAGLPGSERVFLAGEACDVDATGGPELGSWSRARL